MASTNTRPKPIQPERPISMTESLVTLKLKGKPQEEIDRAEREHHFKMTEGAKKIAKELRY